MKRRVRRNPWAKDAWTPPMNRLVSRLTNEDVGMIESSPATYRYFGGYSAAEHVYYGHFIVAVLPRGTKLSRITTPLHPHGWLAVWVDINGWMVGVFDSYPDCFMGRGLGRYSDGPSWWSRFRDCISRWADGTKGQGHKDEPKIAMRLLLRADPPRFSQSEKFKQGRGWDAKYKAQTALDDTTDYVDMRRLAVDYVTETGELARLAGVK